MIIRAEPLLADFLVGFESVEENLDNYVEQDGITSAFCKYSMSYPVRARPGFWAAPAWKLLEAGSGNCLYFKAPINPFAIKTRKGCLQAVGGFG